MSNGTNGSWLRGNENENQSGNSPLAPVKPPAEDVDRLADELALEYQNKGYRGWYCKVIYSHGIERVRYWQEKSRSGDFPGKLFAYYVRQADIGKAPEPPATNQPEQADDRLDDVYQPTDAQLADNEVKQQLDDSVKQHSLDTPSVEPKAIPWLNENDK